MILITKADAENCSKWFDEENIPHYWETDTNTGLVTNFYITVGEYDYEISHAEILYRAELVLENLTD